MLKTLTALLVLLAPAASAADNAFTLDSVRLADIPALAAAAPAQPVPVPYRKPAKPENSRYFNAYVLKAVDYLYANYKLLGYDIHSVLTHDIPYYKYGTISATHAPLTMCVAAQMEVILTAYELYAQDTGDYSIYDYMPKSSFEGLDVQDIKGHIWVNPDFHSDGTADALINFGMGERRTFDKLQPGDFVNINRTTNTGHAVTFLGYINGTGKILPSYGPDVVGFKYFSSQGKKAAGEGGLDYRYAVFSQYGCPDTMPYKRDCNVIYSTDQRMLNTGTMLAPRFWTHVMPKPDPAPGRESVFNAAYFDGVTTDD
jgi:hypothetical protein